MALTTSEKRPSALGEISELALDLGRISRSEATGEVCDVGIQLSQTPAFLGVLDLAQAGLGDQSLPGPRLFSVEPQVRQGPALLEKHPTQGLAQARELQLLPGLPEHLV